MEVAGWPSTCLAATVRAPIDCAGICHATKYMIAFEFEKIWFNGMRSCIAIVAAHLLTGAALAQSGWKVFDAQKPIIFHPDNNGWGLLWTTNAEEIHFQQLTLKDDPTGICQQLANTAAPRPKSSMDPICILGTSNGWDVPGVTYTTLDGLCKAGAACDCDLSTSECQAIFRQIPVPGTFSIDIRICPEGSISMGPWDKCSPVVDRWKQREKPKNSCEAEGNPIYPLLGVKAQSFDTGLGLKGFPLVLAYDSTAKLPFDDPDDVPVSVSHTAVQMLGVTWASSYHRRLLVNGGGLFVTPDRGDGRMIAFPQEAGSAVRDTVEMLPTSGKNFRYYDNADGSIENYGDGALTPGLLKTRQLADGSLYILSYSDDVTPTSIAPGPDHLIKVTDSSGRAVLMRYDAAGRPATIIGADGLSTLLEYTAAGYLAKITGPDGKSTQFLYERGDLPWALTGIVNENGTRTSTFGYDSKGRANSTQRAGGVDSRQVTWTTPPSFSTVTTITRDSFGTVYRDHFANSAQSVSVTDANGNVSVRTTKVVNGVNVMATQSLPAGAGCYASTIAADHDSRGNVLSRDDANGTRSCYAYEPTRNVQTNRVEGLAPATACAGVLAANAAVPSGARKVSTQWHPSRPLPTRIAAPKRITTYVYNGQPDPFAGGMTASCANGGSRVDGSAIEVLCKVVEQATTDENGSRGFSAAPDTTVPSRIRTYTYDAAGRTLTATDPRSNTTRFEYYSAATADAKVGDLWKQTNALGHATVFNKYDANGQPLQVTHPDGLVTNYAYDVRRRVKSITTGTETTRFDHDAAGRLTAVTAPDGSVLTYAYDDADRLSRVTDAKGNSVTYTLDNAGNPMVEQVKDATGTLVSTITRTFDALNRLQAVTGAQR